MIDYSQLPSGQRKLWGLMVFGFAVAALSFATLQLYTVWSQAKQATTPFRVTVSGEAKFDSSPDVATLYGTVITKGKTPTEAETENSKKATALIAYVKSQGVEAKDIKTGNFSVNPQYQYYNTPPCLPSTMDQSCPVRRPPEIVGYEVRNSVTVKVRKLDTAGKLLTGMIANGANEVNGPQFDIDDRTAVQAEARRKAIANAKVKAQELAKDLGLSLGKVVDFNESGGGITPYTMYDCATMGMGSGIEKAAPAPIEPGSQETRTTVSVTYELN